LDAEAFRAVCWQPRGSQLSYVRNSRGENTHSSSNQNAAARRQGGAAHQRGDPRSRGPTHDKDGANKGVTEINAAIAMAQEAGLDLVEIAPNSVPPVCKILDFGKYKYQAQKKAAEARKKQKVVEIKEIKLRPMIDDHDYEVKMRSIQRFFEEGDKVKVTLRFRGREMAHQDLGYKLLDRVKGDTAKIAKIEQEPRFEGRQVVMVLAPR
jgi:translation initiation factor IF-3